MLFLGSIQRNLRVTCFSFLIIGVADQVLAKDRLLQMSWWLHEGEHFSVVTNIPDKGDDVVADLELFRAVVLRFTGFKAVEDRLPTRAVIFAKKGEFARIVDRASTLGYTSTTLRSNRMVSSGGKLNVEQRHIVFHEYIHYLLRSATNDNHPSWYDEGLAEMLSTVYERNGQVFVGSAPAVHIRFLNSNQLQMPAGSFVHTDDLSNWHPLKVSAFYATSWAMVNYIYADKTGERVEMLSDYLARLRRAEPREAAFEQAFDMQPRGLERRSRKYVSRSNRAFLQYPRDSFTIHTETTRRKLSKEEVAYELAYLAMFSNTELARKLVEEILQEDPDNASMRMMLAVTYQADEEYQRGIEIARASLSLANQKGVRDVLLEIDLADMLMVWNRDACARKEADHQVPARHREGDEKDVKQDSAETCRARYVEAKEAYLRGLAIETNNPEVRAGLAWALLKLEQELGQALRHIEFALDYQPWSPTLQYRAGMIHKGLDQRDLAMKRLRKALYWAKDGDLREDAAAALAEF